MKIRQIQTRYLIIALAIIVKLTILLIADSHTGFDGDEVMHIQSGFHLDWGYITFQPLIGLVAYIQNLFHSHSLFVHHLFVHSAAALIILFCGLITVKSGGSSRSVALALTCILAAPGFMITNNSFMPLVFDQLFWVISFYFALCFCISPRNKYIYCLAAFLALGFLAKISILILIAGFFTAILSVKISMLRNKHVYFASALFLLIVSPNIYWQYTHGFPSVGHVSALYKTVLNEVDLWSGIKVFFLSLNPVTAVVWLPGIFLFPFFKRFHHFKLAAFAMLYSFLILIVSKGQFYYFYPVMLFALCLGSVFIEHCVRVKKFIFISFYSFLLITGIIFITFGTTLLPLDKYIKINKLNQKGGTMKSSLFFTKQSMFDNKSHNGSRRIPVPYEAYYAQNDWNNLFREVAVVCKALPDNDKLRCLIWGRYYTQAGAANLFCSKYALPPAFSFNAGYYAWVPSFDKGITVIAVTNSRIKDADADKIAYFSPYFDDVEFKQSVFCPYARENHSAYYHIYLCRGLKYNSLALKQIFKSRIFE